MSAKERGVLSRSEGPLQGQQGEGGPHQGQERKGGPYQGQKKEGGPHQGHEGQIGALLPIH